MRARFLKLVAAAGPLLASTAVAQLVDTFDPAFGGVTAVQGGSAPGPTVTAGGPTGSFLRLTDAVNSQNSRYIYDRTDVGAFETINATLDYRASSGASADGFGLVFLPTSSHGTTGDGPGLTAEEPNLGGAFSLGIDLYPAGSVNYVSFHWNGSEQTNARLANNVVDFNNDQFHRLDLTLQRVGNGTNATLTITPDIHGVPGTPAVVLDQAIDMLPYENRLGLYGRTGGLNVAQDIDNLSVTSTGTFAGGLPVAPTGHLFQDFDSAGAAAYKATTHSISTSGIDRPGPRLMAADAGSDGAFLRLVNDGVGNNNNSVAFNRAIDGGITNKATTLSMDLRMDSAGNPADGIGVLFVPTAQYGEQGPGPGGGAFEQAAGPENTLKVGFDLYNGENDLVVHAGATELARIDVDPGVVDLNSGAFNRFHITFAPTAAGGDLTVDVERDINGTAGARTQIGSVSIPGAQAFDYRVQIGGRTGGAFHSADLDNLRTSQTLARTATLSQTFETNGGVGGTGYQVFRQGAGTPPALVDAGGDTVLRLIHDGQNGQANTVAFDLTDDGVVTTASEEIVSGFEFRAESAAAAADGFSWRLLPVSIWGDEGLGTNGGGAEEPNLGGVLAVGFDFHPAGSVNDLSLHYGTELANVTIDTGVLDLDDGAFHDVSIYGVRNGGDLVVDVSIDGVTHLDDITVPGFTWSTSRLEFAARSGGLNMTVDLDDVTLAIVPEPSGALLALLGGLGLLCARRRR